MSYRFLLSRRWLLLTVVALVLIPVMVRLGFWQYHRHEDRVANNEKIAEGLDRAPIPAEELTRVGREVRREDFWRPVSVTGRYDTEHEVVARNRLAADESTIGYFVVTPLVAEDGTAILVNRGWVSPGNDITTYPKVPKAPSGTVTLTGRLRPDETTGNSGIKDHSGLPDRQIMLINSEKLGENLPYPLLGGYIELAATKPKPGGAQPELVPAPDHSSIGTHFAYAIQWWLFAVMVPVGWVVLARRERKDLLEQKTGKKKRPAAAAPPRPRPTPRPGPPTTGPSQGGGAPAARAADGGTRREGASAAQAADGKVRHEDAQAARAADGGTRREGAPAAQAASGGVQPGDSAAARSVDGATRRDGARGGTDGGRTRHEGAGSGADGGSKAAAPVSDAGGASGGSSADGREGGSHERSENPEGVLSASPEDRPADGRADIPDERRVGDRPGTPEDGRAEGTADAARTPPGGEAHVVPAEPLRPVGRTAEK